MYYDLILGLVIGLLTSLPLSVFYYRILSYEKIKSKEKIYRFLRMPEIYESLIYLCSYGILFLFEQILKNLVYFTFLSFIGHLIGFTIGALIASVKYNRK